MSFYKNNFRGVYGILCENDADPISQGGNVGVWLKRSEPVDASQIGDSIPITTDIIKSREFN